jgi:1,4-dihydroxy-2-naphthoate octaprenyltransferase
MALAVLGVVGAAATSSWWALLGLALLAVVALPTRQVLAGAAGRDLVGVLRQVGIAQLVCAAGLFVGLVIA